MYKNGRMYRVHIDLENFCLESDKRFFLIWADKGLKDVIKSVDGIAHAYNTRGETQYNVEVDKRYDPMYVISVVFERLLEAS